MSMKFFYVPVFSPEPQCGELNQFLLEHPHALVDRQLITDGQNSVWAVCCTLPNTIVSVTSMATSSGRTEVSRKRIDYRDVLEPKHFARFAVLRELRNRLASEQGIPAYSIFSNAQLAEMVQLDSLNRQSLSGIEGIGEKRIALYAEVFIKALEAI